MTDKNRKERIMNHKKDLGVYIHIPFCLQKCKYCDFLSFVSDEKTMKKYVKSLCEEIRGFFLREKDYQVITVYLGGGTPSILKAEWTKEILTALKEAAVLADNVEISTEANPGTLTEEKLKQYKECGINRLSIGLQTTVEKELQYLGRIHSYEQFLEGYHLARKAGFENINIDLMSAVPYQTMESWKATLDRILALKPEHISGYSLIVEEGTPFYEDEKLDQLIPDEDTEREMYKITETKLLEQGYHRYEVSNYSLTGKECAHNILYWRRGDYIGFGLGAASCIRDMRFKNTDSMEEYLEQSWKEYNQRDEFELLSLEEQMAEEMILGLRMTKGISKEAFYNRYGVDMDSVYGEIIKKHKKNGLLIEENDFIRFTKQGLDLSNIVLCEFV